MKKTWKRLWTRIFDPIWDGDDQNFETEGVKKVVANVKRLPFDDIDEWLAIRLSAYSRSLMEIENAPRNSSGWRYDQGTTVQSAVQRFVARSLQNKWYRRLLQAEQPTAYTKAMAQQLKLLLGS